MHYDDILVSIIVPVYNAEKYIDQCVSSILNQTYRNIEVVLVDDGSPDNCPQICDNWSLKDRRIKVVHKKNGGLSDARNYGLDMANGQFVTFTDSDDIIECTMIEDMLNLHFQYDADIVCCESLFYENGSEKIIPHYHVDKEITQITPIDFLRGLLHITIDCSVCNKLFRKELIDNHRFQVGKYNEDILFLFDLVYSKAIIHTNKGYYKYRITEGSITHTFNEKSLDALYNSLELLQLTRDKYPMLVEDAKYLCVIRSRWLVNEIRRRKHEHTENDKFRKAYRDAIGTLHANIPFVILSPFFDFRGKARIIKYLW